MRPDHIAGVGIMILALTACAHTPAKPTYQPVAIAVPTSCVPAAMGVESSVDTPSTLAAIPDGPTRYLRTAAAYLALYGWSLSAGPVLEGCR